MVGVARYRREYEQEQGLCDRVFTLLGTWLPQLPERRFQAASLGMVWEQVSTPFVREAAGQVVSHVGLLPVDITLGGVRQRIGGVHAVCTRADRRRRGLYRSLIEVLLPYADAHYPWLQLSTDNPEFYEPFGFRVVPYGSFAFAHRHPGGGRGFRRLSLRAAADIARLRRLLAQRKPHAQVFDFWSEAVFKFNLTAWPSAALRYHAGLDLLVIAEVQQGVLYLYDLICARTPPLDELLCAFAEPFERVLLSFRPDRFRVATTFEPHRAAGDYWLVRGDAVIDALDRVRVALPPTIRH